MTILQVIVLILQRKPYRYKIIYVRELSQSAKLFRRRAAKRPHATQIESCTL